MAHDVFISYATRDKDVADSICAGLEGNRVRCWIAPRDIMPGTPYAEAIVDAIAGTRVVVVVLSSESNVSQHVLRELERSVARGIAIVPFRVEDAPLSKQMQYYVGQQHWLDAITPPLEQHIHRLSDAVIALLGASEPDEAPPAARSEKPRPTEEDMVRLTVHFAHFARTGMRCCFINATNLARDVDIELTHVWIDTNPQVHARNPDRPLPKRLRPHESWETWIPCHKLPPELFEDRFYTLARARLSTGQVVASVRNETVPERGTIPGGPIGDGE